MRGRSGPAEPDTLAGPCALARPALAGMAAGEPAPSEVADHVAHCLRCQAELARYRRLVRGARALRHDLLRPPPGALAGAIATLAAADARRRQVRAAWARRAVCVGGITVATGAAGVLVWLGRRRLELGSAG